MSAPALARLWLALGAFGNEAALLVALPLLGRLHGAAEVAVLGVAIMAATAGKLVGCLKLDAAITNAGDAQLGTTHALAAATALGVGLALWPLVLAAEHAGALPAAVRGHGDALWLVFTAGALQQASAMRLLREDRLALFALVKALPSCVLLLMALGRRPGSLIDQFLIAQSAAVVLALLCHARPPAGGWPALWRSVRQLAPGLRTYALEGSPASLLDAANLLLLSLLAISLAGAEAAGAATQLQRVALAPALAGSMLLAQSAWRLRLAPGEDAGPAYRHALRWTLLAGVASIACAALLLGGGIAAHLGVSTGAVAGAIAACLALTLAQYAGSPLTVFFFKRERIGGYLRLQLMLVAAALGVALLAYAGLLGPDRAGPAALLTLAGFSLLATLNSTRRAVHG